MKGAVVYAACVLRDTVGVDPKEVDVGVAHLAGDAVEDAFPDR